MKFRAFKPRQIRSPNERLWALLIIFSMWLLFSLKISGRSFHFRRNISVGIIIAATQSTDLAWVKNLTIPGANVNILPFIADDPEAPFHPAVNKGREAYLTYFYLMYENLPEISILIHGEDQSWHIDPILEGSTAYALQNLDLQEVARRKYLNLRVDWTNACPDWIKTGDHVGDTLSKLEEPFMKDAFLKNFPNDYPPEILSQPCCSQFAVTKEAIRSVSREQYQAHIDWLTATKLDDHIAGRIWEHLWQYLFLKKAVYCPEAHKAVCRGWHICFETKEDLAGWNGLASSLASKRNESEEIFKSDVTNLPKLKTITDQIVALETQLKESRDEAINRGRSIDLRNKIAGDL